MRSEIQFFMTLEDELEFERQVEGIEGAQIVRGTAFDNIFVDQVPIQYERSQVLETTLSAGRLAIATTGFGLEQTYLQPSGAESAYKKLRNWIRKHFSNSLTCHSESSPHHAQSPRPIKFFWLGQHAEQWAKNHNGTLKQFHSGSVIFTPAS